MLIAIPILINLLLHESYHVVKLCNLEPSRLGPSVGDGRAVDEAFGVKGVGAGEGVVADGGELLDLAVVCTGCTRGRVASAAASAPSQPAMGGAAGRTGHGGRATLTHALWLPG